MALFKKKSTLEFVAGEARRHRGARDKALADVEKKREALHRLTDELADDAAILDAANALTSAEHSLKNGTRLCWHERVISRPKKRLSPTRPSGRPGKPRATRCTPSPIASTRRQRLGA